MKKKINKKVSLFLILIIVLFLNCISYNTLNVYSSTNFTNNMSFYSAQMQTQTQGYTYPVMDEFSCFQRIEEPPSPKPVSVSEVEEYDWRNCGTSDYLTPIKNQQGCGSCWAFAAIGVLESIIKIREGCSTFNPDLSEQYILSCLPLSGSCGGGWAYRALNYMMQDTAEGNFKNGALLESCFPYGADDDLSCSEKCENWEENLIPILNCGYWVPDGSINDRDKIKAQILETGPVAASIHANEEFIRFGSTYHNSSDYFQYPGPVGGINHVVMIIGWKDNDTINNGGYWVCKNSWGKEWGYQGYFNIEYGSLNIDNQFSMITWADYDPISYNWEPIADIGGPYFGYSGKMMVLNASRSFDPDGDIMNYSWDLGDGNITYGKEIKHIYSKDGVYTAVLVVKDPNGKQSMSYCKIIIQEKNNSPEIVTAYGRMITKVNKSYFIDISATDPEDNNVYFRISWDADRISEIGPIKSEDRISLKHIWKSYGFKTIKITSYDDYYELSSTKYLFIFVFPQIFYHLDLPIKTL